ncbi:MAG: YaaL family protein [Bacilli bacterium]|nr:YaaL family protein [Bacilli bacterium]
MKKRAKAERIVDQDLLNAIFVLEDEWQKLRDIVDRSVDPLDESRYKLKLSEGLYMFLLKEAKNRKISALRY